MEQEKEPVWISCQVCGKKVQQSANGVRKYCLECADIRRRERSKANAAEKRLLHEQKKAQKREVEEQEKMLARQKAARKKMHKPTVREVSRKADELGISYGKCSALLDAGKIEI